MIFISVLLLYGCNHNDNARWLKLDSTDKNGVNIVWYADKYDTSHQFFIGKFNSNDTQMVVEIRHGKRDGLFKLFTPGNKVSIVCNYKDDSIDGKAFYYDKDKLLSIANYGRGKRISSQYKYYSTGMIKEYHCFDEQGCFFMRYYNVAGVKDSEDDGKYLGSIFLERDSVDPAKEKITFYIASPPDDSVVFVFSKHSISKSWNGSFDTLPIFDSRVDVLVDRLKEDTLFLHFGVRGWNRKSHKSVYEAALFRYP